MINAVKTPTAEQSTLRRGCITYHYARRLVQTD